MFWTAKAKSTISRRQALKMVLCGGLVAGSITYSRQSHAFAYTAASKAYGELMGELCGRLTDELVKEITDMFWDNVTNISASMTGVLDLSNQTMGTFNKDRRDAELAAAAAPTVNYCKDSVVMAARADSARETESIKTSLNNLYHGKRANISEERVAVDHAKGMASVNKSHSGETLSDTDKEAIIDFMSRVGTVVTPQNVLKKQAEWHKAPTMARQVMAQTAIQAVTASLLSPESAVFETGINETYHSEAWRNELDMSHHASPLYGEYTLRLAEHNSLKHQILLQEELLLINEALILLEQIALDQRGTA